MAGGDVDQALAEGADDPPAAEIGDERDGDRRRELHPDRDRFGVGPVTAGDQGKRHHAHGLLRVIGAMRQRDKRCAADLPPPEIALTELVHHAIGDAVHQPAADEGNDESDDGGDERGDEDLADHAVELGAIAIPLHAGEAEAGCRGTGQAAEQGVRGGTGQAEEPGEEVPDDPADQSAQDDEQQFLAIIDKRLGNRGAALVLQLDHGIGDGERDLDR